MLLDHVLRLSWICLLLFISSGSGFPYQMRGVDGGPDFGHSLGHYYSGGADNRYYYDPRTGQFYGYGGDGGSGTDSVSDRSGSRGSGSGSYGSESSSSGSSSPKVKYLYYDADSGSGGVVSGSDSVFGMHSKYNYGPGLSGYGGVGDSGSSSAGSGYGGSGSSSYGADSSGSGSVVSGPSGMPFYMSDPQAFDLRQLKLPQFPFPDHWLYPDVPAGTIPQFLHQPTVRLIQNSNNYQRAKSVVAHTKYTQDDWGIVIPFIGNQDQVGQVQGGSKSQWNSG